jgi:hypothetical protein
MKMPGARFLWLSAVLLLLAGGCNSKTADTGAGRDGSAGPEAAPEVGAETGPDSGAEAATALGDEVGPERGMEAGPELGAEPGREAGPEAASEAASDGAAESRPEVGRESEPGPDAGAEVGRETAAEVRGESGSETAVDVRTEAGSDTLLPGDAGQPTYKGRPQPMCVWNEAYQENYAADTVLEILGGASNCYVLVDPFTDTDVSDAVIPMEHSGNLVSCYISVGTCEDWRDDFAAMKPFCVSKQWGQWPGEYFVDRTDTGLVDVMKARIDKMTAWGCQMVEFDNMDFAFDSANRSQYGITATAAQAEAYNQTLCAYVHANGMGCMAKSSTQGATDFDGLTVESAPDDMDWWNPGDLTGMLSSGKIGIVVHYNESDCATVRSIYQTKYGTKLSFICEDKALKKYRHFP